jgi:hypothetical protein
MRTIPPPSWPRMTGNAPYGKQQQCMRKWYRIENQITSAYLGIRTTASVFISVANAL